MSDDYERDNSPNEEELMEQLDRYLSGAPSRFVVPDGYEVHPVVENYKVIPGSILDIQLQQAAERQGRRRVDGEGRGIWHPEYERGSSPVPRPASPLERDLEQRLRGLTAQGRDAVIAAMQQATLEAQTKAQQIVSEAEAKAKVIIEPPRSMEPEHVDRMIADALAKPSPLPKSGAEELYDALRDMQKAIGVLRGFDDPIIKRAVTDLEMAAIGVAMQAERHG